MKHKIKVRKIEIKQNVFVCINLINLMLMSNYEIIILRKVGRMELIL